MSLVRRYTGMPLSFIKCGKIVSLDVALVSLLLFVEDCL